MDEKGINLQIMTFLLPSEIRNQSRQIARVIFLEAGRHDHVTQHYTGVARALREKKFLVASWLLGFFF